MLLTVLLVTAITASLVASSVVFFAESADADRGDKIKEKVKKIIEKIKEKRGKGGGDHPDRDPPGSGGDGPNR